MYAADYTGSDSQKSLGFPDGSVFSPIILTFFVKDMCLSCVSKTFNYADVLLLLATSETHSDNLGALQQDYSY